VITIPQRYGQTDRQLAVAVLCFACGNKTWKPWQTRLYSELSTAPAQ